MEVRERGVAVLIAASVLLRIVGAVRLIFGVVYTTIRS